MLERNPRGTASDPPFRREYVTRGDITHFLRRYLRLIALCVLAMVTAAAIYVFFTTPLYTARAQLLIDAKLPHIQLRETSTEASAGTLDAPQVESQIAVLRSDEIAGRVVDAQNLMEDPEFQPTRAKVIGFLRRLLWLPEPAITRDELRRYAMKELQDGLDVRRAGTSYVLDVAFESPDRQKAARLANAIADAYLRDILETRSRAARLGSQWLEDRVAELRSQMNAAARRVQEFKASQDYRLARRAERGIPGGPSTPTETPAAEPTTLEELESTALTFRKIYENFYLAFTEAVQKESYPVSNARIISPAAVPTGKSHPKTLLILVLGALLGCLIGVGIALLRQSMEQPVRSAQQVREEIGLECLGMVPKIGVGASAPLLVRAKRAVHRLIDDSESTRPAYAFAEVLDAPFSPFSDGMKRLKTAVSLASRTHPLHCIGVLSSSPREGKTTVASNLATLFAVSGARTLLIDADVRNATLSRGLAANAERGLLQVLDGSAKLADCVVPLKTMSIDLLPVATKGLQPANTDMLGSEQMDTLFKTIRESYEMVIVDLPPLRPVADALAVSAVLDGVILVAEWDMTQLPVLTETVHALRIAQAAVIGTVLTKVEARAAEGSPARARRYLYQAY